MERLEGFRVILEQHGERRGEFIVKVIPKGTGRVLLVFGMFAKPPGGASLRTLS